MIPEDAFRVGHRLGLEQAARHLEDAADQAMSDRRAAQNRTAAKEIRAMTIPPGAFKRAEVGVEMMAPRRQRPPWEKRL